MTRLVLEVLAGFLLLYAVLVVLLWRAYRHEPDAAVLRTAVRMLPDLVRLLRGLAGDPELPRGVRLRLVLLVGYLLFPLDLVPDFVPVLGYADDALVVAVALRSVIRHAGADALVRHWAGTPEGLRAVQRLAGVRKA